MIPSSLWEHPYPRRRHQTVGLVLEMPFFQFDGEFYLQVPGAAICPSLCPPLSATCLWSRANRKLSPPLIVPQTGGRGKVDSR